MKRAPKDPPLSEESLQRLRQMLTLLGLETGSSALGASVALADAPRGQLPGTTAPADPEAEVPGTAAAA
jgi:hypothetical protein